MPRPLTGQIIEKPWADGDTTSYLVRVYAYGRRERVTLGTNTQGWNQQRAELELERIVQQIERGTWVRRGFGRRRTALLKPWRSWA
jgi:hypothetical protein